MSPVRPQLIRTAVILAISALLGFGGVLDPVHAVVFGCLLLVGFGLRADTSLLPGSDWPDRRFPTRSGNRNAVSDLAWQVFDTDRRVRGHVHLRVRDLATARLAALGVNAADPAQQDQVARLLGPRVAAGLFSTQRPTARTLQTWLDAIDRLNPERTTR